MVSVLPFFLCLVIPDVVAPSVCATVCDFYGVLVSVCGTAGKGVFGAGCLKLISFFFNVFEMSEMCLVHRSPKRSDYLKLKCCQFQTS